MVRFYRLVLDTPALSAALVRYQARGEHALATALDGAEEPSLTARLAAGQILVVLRTLGHENQMRIAAGRSADDLAEEALAEADHAFALLASGLAPYRAE